MLQTFFLEKNSLFLTLLLLVPIKLWAHDAPSSGDPYEQAYRYGILLEKISRFETNQTNNTLRKAAPFVKISGKNYYINNAFYELTEEILRLYTNELAELCPECRIPSPQEINQHTKELVAKGYFEHFKEHTVENIASPMGAEFVDIGARFGHMAGALKVAGEIAEEALLAVFMLPTAHFLCEIITLVIAARSGNVLTLYRTWKQAGQFHRNGLAQLIRLTATSWIAKRALRKLRLDYGPVEVDPLLFSKDSAKDPSKEWLSEEIEDEKQFRRFFKKSQKLLEKYQKNEQELLTRITKLEEKGLSTKKVNRQLTKLRKKMSQSTAVTRKIFEGRGYGVTFKFIKRRRFMTMFSGEPELNSTLKGSKAWIVPLTATVIEPGFDFIENFNKDSMDSYIQRISANQSLSSAPIDQLLAQEASLRGLNQTVTRGLFNEIDIIFDSSRSRQSRYIHATFLQSFVGEFLYQVAKSYLRTIRKEVINRDKSFRALGQILSLYWKVGQITYYANMYSDYIKSVTLLRSKNNFGLEKSFAKEYLLTLVESYEVLGELKEIPDLDNIKEINEKIKQRLRTLNARRFWIEKKATRSLLPVKQSLASLLGLGRYQLFRKRVQCGQLYY